MIKSIVQKLLQNLAAATSLLNLNLTNSNCSDSEFSSGRIYNDGAFTRFSDIFVEECDQINSASWFCGERNQGSALSYRLKFQSFKKVNGKPFLFGPEVLLGACRNVNNTDPNDLLHTGLDVNFPSGNGATPFVVSVEMFLGSNNCNSADAKGIHNVVLENGLGKEAGPASKIVENASICTNLLNSELGADPITRKNRCESYSATWTGSACADLTDTILRFIPAVDCAAESALPMKSIKHLISIPQQLLCGKYLGQSAIIGSHPFAGGNGTTVRPYKICTEWQHNQIGEVNITIPAPFVVTNLAHFKLMNDLDMNKTDFGPYAKPSCVGSSANIESHHNTNPIPRLESACGTVEDLSSANGFEGSYNGNGKTISNVRISTKGALADRIGFIRKLHTGSFVRNLNFKNLEVRGHNIIGGVAASVSGDAHVRDIKIDGLDVEGKDSGGVAVAGVVGDLQPSASVKNVVVNDAEIRGNTQVGGIVGLNTAGIVSQVGFSGKIDHTSGADFVGGIVAKSQGSGTIENSYSKGVIYSTAYNTGGIVGSISTGNLTSLYSTMTIISNYTSGNANVGGIVGNTGATLTDVFFDGIIKNIGGASSSIFGVSNAGGTKTNCYSSYSPQGTSCTALTYNEARNHVATTFSDESKWVKTAGSIPRSMWEQHPCALSSNQQSITSQILSSNKGTLLNPITICSSSQLSDVANMSANYRFYRLAEDINISNWLTGASLIGTLNGTLDGNGKALYGANITVAVGGGAENIGLIKTNNGTIKNLKLINNIINGVSEDTNLGLLAGKNNGTIFNVEAFGNEVTGFTSVGGLVGINGITGKINLVDYSLGFVKGTVSVGGITGLNQTGGEIYRASVDTKIMNNVGPTNIQNFGGVVGSNSGTLSQAMYEGELTLSIQSAGVNSNVGGIAGQNSGSIADVYTDNRSEIRIKEEDNIGGIVGDNTSGTVTRAMALGRVLYNNGGGWATNGNPMHPLVGLPITSSATDSIFLEKSVATLNVTSTIASCIGSGPFTATVSTTTTYLDPADIPGNANHVMLDFNNAGDEIRHFIPITIPLADQFSYNFPGATCNTGSIIIGSIYALNYGTGLPRTAFAFPANFTGINFDLAFTDEVTPANSFNEDRLIEYYKAMMENRMPTLTPPVWELSTGEKHPKLVQLLHH